MNNNNKNVIMVVLDTHRYDRLGCYGYQRSTTPNLDSFASESVFFEHAIAPGQWTIPSHASLFSGEVPAVHKTVQADDALPKEFKTLASRLSETGVTTTGFCNNPLVGVIQNGFKRGFNEFYNYCGVIPSTPHRDKDDFITPLRKLWSKYTQFLRRLSIPIQNAFASPNDFFLAALKPLFVPIWTKAGNFKGMTARSINETAAFMQNIEESHQGSHFVFLNLMETHMPYNPPEKYLRQFLPYLSETPEAQNFLREFNRNAAQWLIPLKQPLGELESSTLSDTYDAEVAYQDHLLEKLISSLDTKYHRENTLVIFLADHGEMLGEHGYLGHGFGVHEELIRVPLFMRVPRFENERKIENRVSITQLFYTVLDYFGFDSIPTPYASDVDVHNQSLLTVAENEKLLPKVMISEAYSPENAIKIMERHNPELIEKYKTKNTHRAVYQNDKKMIAIEGFSRVLYNLTKDPFEIEPFIDERTVDEFSSFIEDYLEVADYRNKGASQQKVSLSDELIKKRMRDLGYLE